MSVLIILSHPKEGSFNHAIAARVQQSLEKNGVACELHSLYAEKFDPVLTSEEIEANDDVISPEVKNFIEAIRASRGIIFVHPNWWGGPPAMLRGWIDRVFRNGFAYHFTEKGPVPHLTDKTIQVFSTSNTPHEIEMRVYGDPLENFWKTIVFGLCGCESFERRNFSSVIISSNEERAAWLDEVEEIVSRRFAP